MLQIGIRVQNVIFAHTFGHHLDHCGYGDTQMTNARYAAHLVWINSNAFECHSELFSAEYAHVALL